MPHSKLLSSEMTATLKKQFDKVFLQLHEFGFLLLTDPSLPSVSRFVADGPVRGSWWSHKSAQQIFAVSEMLEDHADVLIVKLISEKVTFVHRELWGHVYSIGVAREDWQLRELTPSAKQLLKAVDTKGSLQTNKLASELERRLLVHGYQVHTDLGAHAKVIETWDTWAERAGFRARAKNPVTSRRFLEQRLAEMNKNFGGKGRLPWL